MIKNFNNQKSEVTAKRWRDLKIAGRAPHHVGIWSASVSRLETTWQKYQASYYLCMFLCIIVIIDSSAMSSSKCINLAITYIGVSYGK